jgi:hypothetical protein
MKIVKTYDRTGKKIELPVERFIVRTMEEGKERIMTPNQTAVFIAIDEWWKKFGFGPTVENIMFVTGDKSRSNIHRIMKRLCELGVCKRTPRAARSIRPTYLRLRDIDLGQ